MFFNYSALPAPARRTRPVSFIARWFRWSMVMVLLLALLPGLALAQAPTIVATGPTANAHNAPRTSPVQVTFDQALTAGSSAALQVFSAQRGGLRSRGTTPAVVSGSTLTYTPTPPFMPGETVSTTVTTAAAGSGGNLVAGKVVQFTAAAGVGPGEFSGGSNPAVGGAPRSVALGDVDGDGDLDVLTANQNNTVSVRLNDGSGGFSGGSDVAVGSGVLKVVVGDVDGDGDLDLLTVNGGTVSVRLNNGAGVFGGGSEVPVGATSLALAVGDVDGDGDLDLLTASYASGTVSVRLNNGLGVFSGGSDPAVGSQVYSVAVGDVDGDGDLDLLATRYSSGTVSVRLNNGAGVFGGGSNPAVGTNPVSVVVGDVDGDGDLDLVTANSGVSTASVRLNNGLGVFGGGSDPVVSAACLSLALGDVDGDGDLDLLTASVSGTVNVRLNNGLGVFGGGSDPTVGSDPTSLALGDVDGDLDLDLVTPSNNTNTVSVRRNQPTPLSLTSLAPTFGLVGTSVTLTGTTFAGATSVNFNGTAQTTITNNTGTSLTVVVPAGASTGLVTVTTPGGTSNGVAFTVLPPVPTITTFLPASGPIGTSVTLTGSAFNATASQNVVFFGATRAAVTLASTTSLTVTVPLGATYQNLSVTDLATGLTGYARQPFNVTLVGAATFAPKVDAGTGPTPLSAATGDVTGDGLSDVVTVNFDNNTVSVLRNTSVPGAVSFATKVDYATGQGPIGVAIGDLDGDGKPDLAVTNEGSAFVSVLRNTSAGGAVGFAASVNVGVGTRAGSLAIADVDGDGKPDLIVAGFGNSLVLVLRNTSTPGAVSFAPIMYFDSGTDSYGAYAVAVGDVDGDGRPDLAVTNYPSNTVSVLRNTSTPRTVSFAPKLDLGYAYNSYSVALGDLDGDGLADLAMTSLTSVAVFRSTSTPGTVSFAPLVDFSTGQRPFAVSMGDVDGDGRPDLAAAVLGINSVWVLRNTSVPGTISLVAQTAHMTGTWPRSVAIGDMDGDGKPDLTTANQASSTVSVLRQRFRVLNLSVNPGTLSPYFDPAILGYTVSVGNAVSSIEVAAATDNPAASYTVNGTAVTNGSTSGPIALAVGSNTITIVLDGVTYTVTVTRAGAPTFVGFAPASGPAGTHVVISGTHLDQVTGVRFGTGTLTTNFVAQSATSLTVVVPVVASTGLITGTTGMGDGASSATAFTYTPRPAGLVAALAPAGPLSGCLARTLTASASSPAFDTGTGFNNDVRWVVVQADGKVLVGGNFTSYKGTLGNRLVRLNPDGSRDATFATGTGFDGDVASVAVQADGKVLVGGAFTIYNGAAGQSHLVRLNPDGSRDATFATGIGFDGDVASVVVQADGKVLVGGAFTIYNGAAGQSHLVRLNADGSRDATFNAGGTGFDSTVLSVAVQPDGKVLAGGLFTTYNGGPANHLVRLNADGTREWGFTTGSGFDSSVLSVAVQADDQVLVGGSFTTYNGDPANYLVRLNTFGYADGAFNAGGAGFDSGVYTVAVQPDGQVLAGGNFRNYNGGPANYLVRLDANGTLDAGFTTGSGFDSPVYTVALQPDGKVLAGGFFTGYNGAAGQNRLIRLNPNGSANTAPTAVPGASFTFSPGSTTTNPLVTSAAGSYTAVASLHGETSAASNAVVITACPAAPTLTSLNPTAGPIGTSVTLTGTGFIGATTIRFNGTAAVTFSVTSGTTATATVPVGATSGNVTITTPNGTSNGVTFMVITDLVISTGTFASPEPVPAGTYNNITVTGTGRGALASNVTVNGAVLLQTGGALSSGCFIFTGPGSFTVQAGATLGLCDVAGLSSTPGTGSVQTTGPRSFSDDASYRYNGPAAQVTGNALPATVRELALDNAAGLSLTQAVQVRQRVNLISGSLALSGQPLTLLSTATGTALVNNTGGVVSGAMGTMQRHIETNTAASGYRHYSSPVSGETFSTLTTAGYTPNFSGAAAYNTSPTPGRVQPFPTVFAYDQDRIATTTSNYDVFGKGFVAPTTGSAPMEVGRGYAVNAPGSVLVDFTGTFTTGPVTHSTLNRTGPDAGWHLLGNPYPSPIDWSTLTLGAGNSLENLDGAVYVFQSSGPYTGSYRTYQNGLGNPLIPAGAGFFVRTTTPGVAGTLRLNNVNRVTSFGPQPNFGRPTIDIRPQLALTLRNATATLADETILYAETGATGGVDAVYDATKMGNPNGLSLALVAATGEALAIDGRPDFTGATVVPVRLEVPAAGTYSLQATLANLPTGLVAYLRDATTGQHTDLSAQPTTTLTLAAGLNTRYSLVFAPAGPLATSSSLTAAQVVLYPNPAGQAATVQVVFPVAVGVRVAQATVLNALGQVVRTAVLPVAAGQANGTLPTTGLAAGLYVVRLQAGSTLVSKRLVVQ